MGVRGLTSYIARNAELYLKPFELHDCDLVVDGDNLACNLYKDVSGCNSAFGGDYDEYYRTVVSFFHLLFECNICPYVLLDGGYEYRKMRRVEQRLCAKVAAIKHLDPTNCKPIFPLMMREVFVDAARDCGVKVMRCLFEADDEIAVLARKLNCPVLSYDSDFYIHNVKYIPMVTVTMNILHKKLPVTNERRRLKKSEGRCLRKRKQINGGVRLMPLDDLPGTQENSKLIKYLDCCIYTIENLVSGCKLQSDMLPIFAVLLGNDYIEGCVFKKFFSQVCMKATNKKIPRQQRRIVAILRWLKHETKESALEKILIRMKKSQRESLLSQIACATSGYSREKSFSFEYFGLTEDDSNFANSANLQFIGATDECESSELLSQEISRNDSENTSCSSVSGDSNDEICVEICQDKNELLVCTQAEPSDEKILLADEIDFPKWFRERIYSAQLPRFCIDLKYQYLYINNPQIENFLYPDCNEVALRILQLNFYLLHYPVSPILRYLCRQERVNRVQYKRISAEVWRTFHFDPALIDYTPFKEVFHANLYADLFTSLDVLPSYMKLYLLAIIYWAKASKRANMIHFHCLLICLVVLSTIDAKIVPIRGEKEFNKRYKKIIDKEKTFREALRQNQGYEKYIKEHLRRQKIEATFKELHPCEKINFISKIDCIMVQENILKYFKQPEFSRKQHNEFSSTVIHGFSEFQAVVFQMFTLNALCNHPFESVQMAQMYNGVFLYNLYMNLKDRIDVIYYVKNHILRESSTMFEFYIFLVNWCKPFVNMNKYENKKTYKAKIKKISQLKTGVKKK